MPQYAETLEKLFSRRRFGMRPGLERINSLLGRIGNPQNAFRTIHVVGTNGKGSTSAFLSSILSESGYSTALFTSPHLVHFRERFRINGVEPYDERIMPLLSFVMETASEETTFFEIVTALAAFYFAESGVGVAVMEAGMGGGSDATAALAGFMTIVTPISIDHSEYLGNTTAEIAAEKIAIAYPATPVLCGIQDDSSMMAINSYTVKNGNRLYRQNKDFRINAASDGISYHGVDMAIGNLIPGIPGRHQIQNAGLALAAAEVAALGGLKITPEAMAKGVENASWPGRMEKIAEKPAVILDGAHNPAGMAALGGSLEDVEYDTLRLIFGIMQDKDIDSVLAEIPPDAVIYAVSPSIERALPSAELAERCRRKGFSCHDLTDLSSAISKAHKDASKDDLILICGSLFLVGEAKAHFSGIEYQGIRG